MNKITPNHNYDNGYIGLPEISLDLPETVTVEGHLLHRKSEFHISLICAKRIAALIDSQNAEQVESALVQDFLRYNSDYPLITYELMDRFRFVQRDERKTLVIMVNVSGLDGFFKSLSQKYTELPLQPTHITLYTLQPEAGIGILSQEELDQDSRPVKVPELDYCVRPFAGGHS